MNRRVEIPKTITRKEFIVGMTALPIKAKPFDYRSIKNQSAMWIWKDRVLNPESIGKFSRRNSIDTLFLYITPDSCKALTNKDPSALAAIAEMRGENRKIFALVGEPNWSWGVNEIPVHVSLILNIFKNSRIFDGIQFDIEPHSLVDWGSEDSRTKLMDGLIQFYEFIRERTGNIRIEITVNPSYSSLYIGSRSFLERILEHVDAISIMAYRKGIDRAIEWASTSIQIAEDNNKNWRMGLSIDVEEPNISWRNSNPSELKVITEELRETLRHRWHSGNFLGIAYHDYDGLKKLLKKV